MLKFNDYLIKSLNSPLITVWCGCTTSFIVGHFFLEERLPLYGWKNSTVTAKHRPESHSVLSTINTYALRGKKTQPAEREVRGAMPLLFHKRERKVDTE
ncbi:hypothetical protein CEXT_381091 [Caerostris extrusa]|uniref:Uncharacterized protein n=1 Tax=Caerostris extrusa TaxID=172846 RepID=A0AAV4SGA9_CAEEX|nr:hypothetical protein CEXT_381091 [Caerostris extrusa]